MLIFFKVVLEREEVPREEAPREEVPREEVQREEVQREEGPRKEVPRKEVQRDPEEEVEALDMLELLTIWYTMYLTEDILCLDIILVYKCKILVNKLI